MRRFVAPVLLLALSLLLGACGHDDTFRVEGDLDDGATINLRLVYYSDGRVLTGITASKAGHFAYEVNALKPTLVEVYDNDYRILGRFIANPGEDISLRLNRQNPYLIEAGGNDINEQWSQFLRENADDLRASAQKRNELVASYITANPDNPLSELLLVTEFDASGNSYSLADSLFRLIPEENRNGYISASFAQVLSSVVPDSTAAVPVIKYLVKGNQWKEFNPHSAAISLISLSDKEGRDSVYDAIKKLAPRISKSKFDILDLSVDPDTVVWTRSVRNDSATWTQGWVAGAVRARGVEDLYVPTVPYFIVTDSTGRQLWRGQSIKQASQFITTTLR